MGGDYPDWDMEDPDDVPAYVTRQERREKRRKPGMKVSGKSVFLLRDLGARERVPRRRGDRSRGPRTGNPRATRWDRSRNGSEGDSSR